MPKSPAVTCSEPTDDEAYDPCPVTPVVDMVFSRWTTSILWTLQHFGPLRFSELRDRLRPVTPKVLTQRLRQLERDGFISRARYAEVPPRVEYSVTDLGLSMSPTFRLLVRWSEENMSRVLDARQRYDDSDSPRPA